MYLHPAEIQFECDSEARYSSTARLDLRESPQLRDLVKKKKKDTECEPSHVKEGGINARENERNYASRRTEMDLSLSTRLPAPEFNAHVSLVLNCPSRLSLTDAVHKTGIK